MRFSSADYPIFLIAVFFAYAFARRSGIGRALVVLLLGDLAFALIAKDPHLLWDPIGNLVWSAESGVAIEPSWHWAVGAVVVVGAFVAGMRWASVLATPRGQSWLARGLVVALLAVGGLVAWSVQAGTLDDTSAVVGAYAHLLVLVVLGFALGAAQRDASRPLGRVIVLFVASALFYQAWAITQVGPYRYLLALLLATIVLDYYLAIWIEAAEDPMARKALVIVSLCSNLGILFFFKYTNFVTQDVLHLDVRPLHLILPAGISFHTFQSLSYTIDVYRRELRATRSPVQFATFVLFFPQLVAGPIVRAQDLLPQLAELPALELERATRGLFRICVGLFKKIALADPIALAIVDRVFDSPAHFSGLEVLAGVYGYALQIYLDFSAYSDIAIGSADVLGFTLPENFRTPYRSADLQEFWRRWHISLSTWLRDYLYITLGGSRGAPWRTYLNLSVTMLLGGLWHGASWTFIVWGALHGFGLAITRFFQRHVERAASMFTWCAAIAAGGIALEMVAGYTGAGTWSRLVLGWLTLTPLWACATAWLALADVKPRVVWSATVAQDLRLVALLARIGMCVFGVLFFLSLRAAPPIAWMLCAAGVFGAALFADVIVAPPRLLATIRRAAGVVLVFHYVCLAWIFFRASTFDNALDVLRRLAGRELDHANLVPVVTIPIAIGVLCHFFPDGSFGWLRDRFCALPQWARGLVLACVALILHALAQPKIVPFIYFQF